MHFSPTEHGRRRLYASVGGKKPSRMMFPSDKTNARVLSLIAKGKPVSASKHWMILSALATEGKLTTRMAPNGQLEFLNGDAPVLVGP
jgi:hypothetical protein